MNKDTTIIYENGNGQKVRFSTSSDIWCTEIQGASGVDVTISDTQGVGQIGSTMTSMSLQPRKLTVNGFIKGNVIALREQILACVLPGVTGTVTIEEHGESWFLSGAPTKTPIFNDGPYVQEFQFDFYAPYPLWQTTANVRTQIAGLTALFHTPFDTSGTFWISKYNDNLYANVYNSGNMPTAFVATFTASSAVLNPELYHIGKGTFLKLKREMQTGEVVTISTMPETAGVTIKHADGTVENGFRYLDFESDLYLTLDAGDNLFRYQADENHDGLNVSITAPEGVKSGV